MQLHNSYCDKNRLESWHQANDILIYILIFHRIQCDLRALHITLVCFKQTLKGLPIMKQHTCIIIGVFFYLDTHTGGIIQCKLDWRDTQIWAWQNKKRQREDERQRETRENKDSNVKQNQTVLLCMNSQLKIIFTIANIQSQPDSLSVDCSTFYYHKIQMKSVRFQYLFPLEVEPDRKRAQSVLKSFIHF